LLGKGVLKPSTIERKVRALKSLLRHSVSLNPESVISFLNSVSWSSGTKDLVLDAFKDYLRMEGLKLLKQKLETLEPQKRIGILEKIEQNLAGVKA